jgi:uncharacterized protein (TIGR03435 family)
VTASGYVLSVIAKAGVKSSGLSATQSPHRGINAGQGTMLGEAASMADLTSKLSRLSGRPVVNNTGLEGNYDFKLEWTPDPGPAAPDGQPGGLRRAILALSASTTDSASKPQRAGGRLVIDHVNKLETERFEWNPCSVRWKWRRRSPGYEEPCSHLDSDPQDTSHKSVKGLLVSCVFIWATD